MTRPRKQLISRADTPYYHCVSRCVRRAFLCGTDSQTGQSYEHRRAWLENRIRVLSSLFAIDICSYAVMSNHYHIVVKLNTNHDWSDQEVFKRWLTLHRGPVLVQRYLKGESLSPEEMTTVSSTAEVFRQRLRSLSWFMKCLNEPIARMANAEDDCSGHFWEARFKSQALTSAEALLSCMVYVDLNPVRAGEARSPESSRYTSFKERVKPAFNVAQAQQGQGFAQGMTTPVKPLLPFEESISNDAQAGIPYSLNDYLNLVDWSGRAIRTDKHGAISSRLPSILIHLDISAERWLLNTQHFEKVVHRQFRITA